MSSGSRLSRGREISLFNTIFLTYFFFIYIVSYLTMYTDGYFSQITYIGENYGLLKMLQYA
jgi:hypothetical protein